MFTKNTAGFFLLLSVILGSSAYCESTATKAQAPDRVVQDFYKYHFAHDMAFTPDAVKKRSAWLTPELLQACTAYFALPADPDEAPDIEGDVFTGSQEYPDTYAASPATITDSSARAPITFSWKDGHSTKGTVVLKMVKDHWLIDDVEFPDQDSIRKLLASEKKQ